MANRTYYSVEEYRKKFGAKGISRSGFYAMIQRGEGPVITKIGHRTFIGDEDAAEWEKSRRVSPDELAAAGGKAA